MTEKLIDITELKVGVKYKLVDKEAYLATYSENSNHISSFVDDVVTLTEVDTGGDGWVYSEIVISLAHGEYEFFKEVVEGEDSSLVESDPTSAVDSTPLLTKFVDLGRKGTFSLIEAYLDSKVIQASNDGENWTDMSYVDMLSFDNELYYQIKPVKAD